jgi:4-oxalocrotonate tautomerase family enzyme
MPIVRIDMLAGRGADRKAELLRRVTEVLVEVLAVRPEQVRVLLNEVPPEHWAIGGVSVAERLPFFVYGTLKPGESNYLRLLAGRTVREEPATLSGAALFDAGAYPYLVLAEQADGALVEPDATVAGVLIDVPLGIYADVLRELDNLEDFVAGRGTNAYERVAASIQTAAGPVQCWVYIAGPQPLAAIAAGELPRIVGGVWGRE